MGQFALFRDGTRDSSNARTKPIMWYTNITVWAIPVSNCVVSETLPGSERKLPAGNQNSSTERRFSGRKPLYLEYSSTTDPAVFALNTSVCFHLFQLLVPVPHSCLPAEVRAVLGESSPINAEHVSPWTPFTFSLMFKSGIETCVPVFCPTTRLGLYTDLIWFLKHIQLVTRFNNIFSEAKIETVSEVSVEWSDCDNVSWFYGAVMIHGGLVLPPVYRNWSDEESLESHSDY